MEEELKIEIEEGIHKAKRQVGRKNRTLRKRERNFQMGIYIPFIHRYPSFYTLVTILYNLIQEGTQSTEYLLQLTNRRTRIPPLGYLHPYT